MKLFILAASALLAAVIVGGGVTLAQGGPPAVEPGTAKWNCQRIVSAGYSPHDYIYRAESYGRPGISAVDYFHYTGRYNGGTANEFRITFLAADYGDRRFDATLGYTVGFEDISQSYELLRDPEATPPFTRGAKLGDILALDGTPLALGSVSSSERDAYIWRSADGSPDVIYRDRAAVAATLIVETEWVHNPNWNGPDAARMSAIWGDVLVCSG